MCIEANVNNIEDIIAINAFNRPGTKDGFPTYVENKKNPNNVHVIHDDLLKIFGKTHFVLLYQEQTLQLFRHSGFPEDMVDNARRCVDENTYITMGNGNIKKIKEVKEGELVLCVNEDTNKIECKKVNKVFDNGIKKTCKITTKLDNEIIATPEHKVLTQNGWKETKDLTIDDYLMTLKDFCNYCPVKIKKIETYEERHVFDLEIEDNHNYIANNLIVHNCIGKKEKESMKQLKEKFIYGSEENGVKISGILKKGWTIEQAEEIWRLILKQADYSFNRSHSVAYGLTSYIMSYLKYYYPVEFMTSCMNANMEDTSKISVLINECNRLKIKVCPPHINKSDYYFTPHKEENEILFGLLGVKGIGKKSLDEVFSLRPFKNRTDFLNRCSSIDKTTCITLIKAGAIPCKNKRKFALEYANTLIKNSEYKDVSTLPTLLKLRTEWDIDTDIYKTKEERLKIYNKKREVLFYEEQKKKKEKELAEFENKYLQNEYMWEFETLSMFLTNNPFTFAYEQIKGFQKSEDNSKCVCICVCVNIKRKKDKNGNAFAYLDLYTPDGIIESICWSKQYSQHQDLIKKGKSLAILGRKRENKLFVEDIKSYEQWLKDKNIESWCV